MCPQQEVELIMARSYYAILGISPDASTREIKNAYRRLAKRYHPDHEGGDSSKFRDIQEAYSVLADADKRSRYEQQRSGQPVRVRVSRPRGASQGQPEPLIPEHDPFSRRPGAGRRFASGAPEGGDLFDWILRNFF